MKITETQNILPMESIVIHQKFPSCPIIWLPPNVIALDAKNKSPWLSLARFSLIYMLKSAKIVSVGGGMRKRISCKVIRTIPLSQCGVELRHESRSNHKPHNISNASRTPNTKKYVWESAANAQARRTNNSFTYSDRLDIKRMSIDDGLTAQVLDIYV